MVNWLHVTRIIQDNAININDNNSTEFKDVKGDEMKISNKDIRKAIAESGHKQWEVAWKLGMSEATLCRKLRIELPEHDKEVIIESIRNIQW